MNFVAETFFLPVNHSAIITPMKKNNPYKNLVITFDPDATVEEEEKFLTEYARAIWAVAKHLVDMQDGETDEVGS